MATAAAVARNLLRNSNSLPQILRCQILGRSSVAANLNKIANEHQIVQSFFVSNQKWHAQMPIFDFTEMGSLLGSSGMLSMAEKEIDHMMRGRGFVVEARGRQDEDEDEDDDDDEDDDEFDEFDDEIDDEFEDDDDDDIGSDDDEDDDGRYSEKI